MEYRKIDISQIPEEIPGDIAKEFIDHRINLKKPLTQGAFKRALKEALEAPNRLGMSPEWAITKTIDNGWRGINLEWLVSHIPKPQIQPHQSSVVPIHRDIRSVPIEEKLTDRSWAK